MSGPKVVRVITREERIAICEALLARLESALADWEINARGCALDDAELVKMRARQAELRSALESDRFDEVERHTESEIRYVMSESERLMGERIRRKAMVRRMRKRAQELDPELARMLERERRLGEVEMSEEQIEIARALREAGAEKTYSEWLAENPSESDRETASLETKLAELVVLLGDERVRHFEAMLEKAAATIDQSNRQMRLDTLSIELGSAVENERRGTALHARIRALIAELRALKSSGALRRAESVIASVETAGTDLDALEAATRTALEAERQGLAAAARRKAVLQGLASLGYAVDERLETAWVRDERVVVRRPSQPGYGVEFTGKVESGRIQARVVAVGSSSYTADAARDRDAETLWCSDFSRLRDSVTATGGELIIEKALGIGAVPVKVVSAPEADYEYVETSRPKERTLPKP